MRVAALGRTGMLYDAVEELIDRGHEVPIVVTCGAEPEYDVDADDFARLADRIGASFHDTLAINDTAMVDRLRASGSAVAVSVNWKTLLDEAVLESFEHGVLNAHAGDLPRYRGNAAPNWAIVNGENEVGVVVHRMTRELDAGPVFERARYPLTDETTLGEVYEFLGDTVPTLFGRVVDGLAAGTATAEPQPEDPSAVLRAYPRKPKDSELNWERSADHLDRVVRASSEPLFGAFTYLGRERLRVWQAFPESPAFEVLGTPGQVAERRPETGEVAVVAGEGFLVLETVQREDGPRVDATDAITSARTRLGMDLQGEIKRLDRRLDELAADTTER